MSNRSAIPYYRGFLWWDDYYSDVLPDPAAQSGDFVVEAAYAHASAAAVSAPADTEFSGAQDGWAAPVAATAVTFGNTGSTDAPTVSGSARIVSGQAGGGGGGSQQTIAVETPAGGGAPAPATPVSSSAPANGAATTQQTAQATGAPAAPAASTQSAGNGGNAEFAAVASKLGGDLAALALGGGPAAAPDDSASADAAAALGLARAPVEMTVIGGMVAIDASSTDGDIAGLLAQLQALGLQNGSTWGNTLSGLLPIGSLVEASGIGTLAQARAAMAMSNAGSVSNQADVSMQTDHVRANFAVNGTGVTVGVMSDSFDDLGGAATDIGTGDLPAAGVTVIQDLGGGGIDEGRAMAQLIHDIVPGAALQFRTAFLGQADFANGIQQLIAAGSDVIVDDIFYFAEPFFQDGIITQSADQAVELGVPYFSSAGNSGDNSYQSTFRNSGQTISYTNGNAVAINNAQLHDFDPGAGVDTLQSFTFAGTSATGGLLNRFRIGFQWDEPFSSVSSANGGATSDYDILLRDNAGNIVSGLTASTSVIGGDPFEFFDITYNGSGPAQFNLSIARAAGSTANLLKTVVFRSTGFTLNEFDTQSSTVVGHSNAALAMGVGAAFYQDTPEFGTDPAVNEDFSSLGGTPTIFDTLGNRLAAPIIRQGPDITAPDGTDTTFFGSSDPDGTGFPNFFGTSAAAPHAAAVAALLLQINPNATPDDLFDAMLSTAQDMGIPGTDQLSGAGFIDALAAANALNLDDVLVGTNANNPLNGREGNDVLVGRGGNDVLIGGPDGDMLLGGSGTDFASYATAGSAVQANLGNPASNTGDAAGDSYNSIEGLIGSNFGDVLIGDSGDNELIGGAGGDQFNGGSGGLDFASYATSSVGVRAQMNVQTANTGHAVGDSYTAIDGLIGSNFNDFLVGDGNDNQLRGGSGNDFLNGLAGIDTLLGEGGSDTLFGGPGGDLLNGGADTDFASYSDALTGVNAQLNSNVNNTGDATGDTYVSVEGLIGSASNDRLVGDAGDNIFRAGGGNDVLIGLDGADTYTMEAGNDRVVIASATQSMPGANRDQITDWEDFGDDDTIDLSGFAGTLTFIGAAGFSAPNQVRAVQVAANVIVQINTVGVGIAEAELFLANTNIAQVDISDFIL